MALLWHLYCLECPPQSWGFFLFIFYLVRKGRLESRLHGWFVERVFKVIFWCDASGCFQHVLCIYIYIKLLCIAIKVRAINIWYRCYLWNPLLVTLIRWSSLEKHPLSQKAWSEFFSGSAWCCCPKVLKGRYLEKNATRLILESDLGSWDLIADLETPSPTKEVFVFQTGRLGKPPCSTWRCLRLMILKPLWRLWRAERLGSVTYYCKMLHNAVWWNAHNFGRFERHCNTWICFY